MNREEAQELIAALLARPNVIDDTRTAFAQYYPEAPKEMIDTATFHVSVDGIDAALEWVAAIELFLRNPMVGLDYSATWHLLHHLYNWQQFQALLPLGRIDIAGHLADVNMMLDEGNEKSAREIIQDLINHLSGDLSAPKID